MAKVYEFAEGYRKFISECKTERECVTEFVARAEKAGFLNLAGFTSITWENGLRCLSSATKTWKTV